MKHLVQQFALFIQYMGLQYTLKNKVSGSIANDNKYSIG